MDDKIIDAINNISVEALSERASDLSAPDIVLLLGGLADVLKDDTGLCEAFTRYIHALAEEKENDNHAYSTQLEKVWEQSSDWHRGYKLSLVVRYNHAEKIAYLETESRKYKSTFDFGFELNPFTYVEREVIIQPKYTDAIVWGQEQWKHHLKAFRLSVADYLDGKVEQDAPENDVVVDDVF